MKTERMVLLVTPDEKARITAESGKLGVSASEYIRKLVGILDAEDVKELESIAPILPLLGDAIDNMERTIAATMARFEEMEQEREHRQSDEYRAKVREELLSDPTIDWDALDAIFGERVDEQDQAA